VAGLAGNQRSKRLRKTAQRGEEAVKKPVTVTSAEPEIIEDQRIFSSADDCHLIFSQHPVTVFRASGPRASR
jgi:hypothetical protein